MSRNHSTQKHDRPAFKWQGKGVHAYTKAPDAQAYVNKCRERESAKLQKKLAALAVKPVLSDTEMWCTPFVPTVPQRGIIVASGPAVARTEAAA